MLYIVPTPIGNLRDITLRSIDVLKKVDMIVTEDTRRTGKLLKEYEIPKKAYISYNDYNAQKKIPLIIKKLKEDYIIALVSENGTPAISDPGYKLIRECIKENISIIPIPGCAAFVPAIVGSGLPTDKFTFYGFLPKGEKKKKELISIAIKTNTTAIFYESPHRIKKTCEVLKNEFPFVNICVARELTKKFEEFIRGSALEVYEKLPEKPKGEFVLVVSAKEKTKV